MHLETHCLCAVLWAGISCWINKALLCWRTRWLVEVCPTLTQQLCKKVNYWFSMGECRRGHMIRAVTGRSCHINTQGWGSGLATSLIWWEGLERETCTQPSFFIILDLNSCGSWSSQESSLLYGSTMQQGWYLQFSAKSFKKTKALSILHSEKGVDCPSLKWFISQLPGAAQRNIPPSFSLQYLCHSPNWHTYAE